MDLRKRFFGFAADRDDSGNVRVYPEDLLERLLLFDTYILESIRLHEFKTLIEVFGFPAVSALLKDDSFQLEFDPSMVVQDSTETGFSRLQNGDLKVTAIRLGIVTLNRPAVLAQTFAGFERYPLKSNERDELKSMLTAKLLPSTPHATTNAIAQLRLDLERNHPTLRRAAATSLSRRLGSAIEPTRFTLTFHRVETGDFEAITNISRVLGVPDSLAADVVCSAVVAMSGLCQNIETMRQYTCTVGGRERELPLLEERLAFLTDTYDPKGQSGRLRRVLEVATLPPLDPAKVDLQKLLEVRRSREIAEFRNWLWSIDHVSDSELTERLAGVKAKLGTWVRSDRGKVMRWLAGTAIGAIPVVGPPVGAALGALDAFLLERVLPECGVVTFLGQQYPSLFRDE